VEPSGSKPLPPGCYTVAKSSANIGNYRVYDSALAWLRAEPREEAINNFKF